ncbi:MAG: C40 family peptidase [Bacteroidota bacterium]
MNYGICNLSVVPCRKKPSDKSEMLTQILFGEHFEILYNQKSWCLVRLAYENYECWIDNKQFQPISKKTFNELNKISIPCFTELVRFIVNNKDGSIMPIVMGSSLPYLKDNVCNIGGIEYSLHEKAGIGSNKKPKELIVENSKKYLNMPYLWGGRSPFGIDCSGLTQNVFKLSGIKLPRDACQQAESGSTINLLEESRECDLAFFVSMTKPGNSRQKNKKEKITHVGIILKDDQIIHASGKVRIDKIDHQGIYNVDRKEYSHRLRLLKRVV